MKKKLMISALSSMFAVGMLAACGDTDEMNDGGGGNNMENNPMEDNMEENDGL